MSYLRQSGILGTVAVGMLCAVGATRAEAQSIGPPPVFKVDPGWIPQLPADETLGEIPGVAVDANDHVWILQRPGSLAANVNWAAKNPVGAKCCKPGPAVIELDSSTGKVLRSWGGPGWDHWPPGGGEHGIHIDHDGNVWIAGYGKAANGREENGIIKYTPDGKLMLQLGGTTMSTTGLDPNAFGRPTQFAENPKTNELFIADGYLNRRIIVFDLETGKYKRMWGAYGKPPNEGLRVAPLPAASGSVTSPNFNTIHGVAVTTDGLVYGADRVNDRIQVFKEDGTYVKQFVLAPDTLYFGSVWSVAWSPVYPDYLLVIDGMNNQLDVLNRHDGKMVESFGRDGPYAGQFHWVHQLAVDSHGNVYTVEVSGGHRVQKWVLQ